MSRSDVLVDADWVEAHLDDPKVVLVEVDEDTSDGVRRFTINHLTAEGVILGTTSYMSPEQSRGQAVDKRTDVWAFGCVLYEMLTGRLLFGGETISDTLAAVLKQEPDWQALPADTPPSLRSLLRLCLRKDPVDRLHDIADARIEIQEAIAEPAVTTPTAPPRHAARWTRVR